MSAQGIIPDANEIMKRQRAAGSDTFGHDVYKITFLCDTEQPPLFGAKYNFQLDGVVDYPKFLVQFPTLIKLALKHGLRLVEKQRFDEFYSESVQSSRGLIEKIQALETFPGQSQDERERQQNVGEYSHAQGHLDQKGASGSRFQKVGTLSKSEKRMGNPVKQYKVTKRLTSMFGLREEDKTIPLKNLTIKTAICWQTLLEFLQHTESDVLDAYIVDLTAFCNYIKNFADTPTLCNYIRQLAYDPSMTTDKLQNMYFQSMMQVLLEIAASYDLGDEVGRENLKKVLAEMLACGDLGEGNVKTIMSIFERLVGDVEERFRFCVDFINGILEPSRADVSNTSRSLVDEYLEKNPDKSLQMKISSLRLNIMDLKKQEMDKRIMKVLKIIEMGRKNFDPSAPKLIPQNRLEI
ncbi:mRNA (guanine-7-)methyltransferase [Culex quinquefasciatus]|uniref:mRNA (guanine-N(7))-methyltransferase n=1 Tax=Culex quinquefasciatus TaxID=7176 RepID=B0WDM5_CULQU|nr:mRNA (guanine-7-)methyltransferase [Culex quinquefasciatus]|eukprot:XP_001846809.1 mRNA (guanine-7-)methyltransferase [Culex quinquefasciatus]